MVVLAAAVCTKGGKPLVSRQFVEMTRVRIEGLLAAFPKLMGSNKEHTYVETESVRYVYQPLEQLYMLLITPKSSNILEDLEILHLLARVVAEQCKSQDENEILKNSFELIFAFDEVLTLGYKEKVSLSNIKTYLEMESHDEKIFELVQKNREREAKEEQGRRIREMERKKKEAKMVGFSGQSSTGFGGGSGGSGGFGAGSMGGNTGGGMGGGMGGSSSPRSGGFSKPAEPAKPAMAKGGGMQLGNKKAAGSNILSQLASENAATRPAASAAAAAPTNAAPLHSVSVAIDEKITVVMDRDGILQNLEVKGDMLMTINKPEAAKLRMVLKSGQNDGYKFLMHPHIDKKAYAAENTLGLKDPSRAFPTNNPLGVLKWRLQSSSEDLVPITVNCWPSATDVNIEYELTNPNLVLRDVIISIPIPSGVQPTVQDAVGSYAFTRDSRLEWSIPIIDKDTATGSMEFTGDNSSAEGYFPVTVSFNSPATFCDIEVAAVVHSETGAAIDFGVETVCSASGYEIVES